MLTSESRRFEGLNCVIDMARPAEHVVTVRLSGTDTGEFGDAPFQVLEAILASVGQVELFIDAGDGKAASINVSGQWAAWLRGHKARFVHVHMLTATRFIQLSADFVRRFAELGEKMRIYTERASFEEELHAARSGTLR